MTETSKYLETLKELANEAECEDSRGQLRELIRSEDNSPSRPELEQLLAHVHTQMHMAIEAYQAALYEEAVRTGELREAQESVRELLTQEDEYIKDNIEICVDQTKTYTELLKTLTRGRS